jgi:phosphoribosylanthranilate isomerase
VKICGLTRGEDAELAVALGASAVGFIFWPKSPRVVSPARAREIGDRLPPFVTRVGVFVDEPPAGVERIVDLARLDCVQLHGDETLEDFRTLRARVIKTVTLDDAGAVARAKGLPAGVIPLVDATDRERRGGTGRAADWDRAADLAATRTTILAGGLTAENVRAAVERVRPWAIDTSSGVESAPGVKSAERLRRFFAAVAG